MFKLGFLANGEMLSWDYDKLFSFVKNAGYDCVELIGDVIFAREYKDLPKYEEKYGLKISEVLAQHDFVVTDEAEYKNSVDTVCEQIRKCADIGVDTANLFTGPVPWNANPLIVGRGISQEKAWSLVLGAFDKVLKVAEERRVKIAVENVWGMLAHDFYTNKYLQSRFDSPYLGVNLDPSHDVLYGNTDMAFLVKSWGEKIFHVHIKDAVGVAAPGKFVFPLIGEGCVDFKTFFLALKEIGYEGCASVEFESWAYRNTAWHGEHAPAVAEMKKLIDLFIN